MLARLELIRMQPIIGRNSNPVVSGLSPLMSCR